MLDFQTIPNLHMWLTFAVIIATIVSYAVERVSIEITSLGALVALLLLFSLAPLPSQQTGEMVTAADLLAGFANPALITVVSLLIVGQGLFQTEALEGPVQVIARWGGRSPWTIPAVIVAAGLISAFINNTPVVVVMLPVIVALAGQNATPTSKLLMPLSYISILGGMTTLIGSSTNLLVAGVAENLGQPALDFFSFVVPGGILAAVGLLYVLFVMPRFLRQRAGMLDTIKGSSGRQFIAEFIVTSGDDLVGARSVSGLFPTLTDITIRVIIRGETILSPPFDDIELSPGDIVIFAATRKTITRYLTSQKATVKSATSLDVIRDATRQNDPAETFVLAEAMVSPGSRYIKRPIATAGIRAHTDCLVLGVQRRSHMLRTAMTDVRLESGDVLLIGGTHGQIMRMRPNRDLILLEWSAQEVHLRQYGRRALAIFLAIIAAATSGIVPIVVAALTGALAMILTGCLNLRQAVRAIDQRIIMLIAASIALSVPLQATGGADWIANTMLGALAGTSPTVIISALFLLVAVLTNILSNNATAILFTPIAISIAQNLGVSPTPFVIAVILSANCSFATPIAYQTNLLVMGPGHYKFSDFMIAGIPLVIILWLTFTLFAPPYYGL